MRGGRGDRLVGARGAMLALGSVAALGLLTSLASAQEAVPAAANGPTVGVSPSALPGAEAVSGTTDPGGAEPESPPGGASGEDEAESSDIEVPTEGLAEPADSGLLPALFEPKPPTPIQYDWIRLKSGEWLKGEIVLMRKERLDFDSDELDDLQFDWADIAEIRTLRTHTYRFEGREIVTGVGQIKGSELTIETAEGVLEFDRKQLVAIIPGVPSELNYWRAKASIGLTARAGNTESTEFSGTLKARRDDSLTRFALDYNGTIGALDGERNANTHRANATIDVYLSRRLFVTPAQFEVYHDEFQNVAYRFSPGAGVGYELVNHPRAELEVTLGAGYQFTKFVSVEAGEPPSENLGVMIASSSIELELTKRVDFDADYTLRLGVPQVERTTQNLTAVVEIEITKLLDVDISFLWDRSETPVADRDGVVPKKNDFRLVVGIGIEY